MTSRERKTPKQLLQSARAVPNPMLELRMQKARGLSLQTKKAVR